MLDFRFNVYTAAESVTTFKKVFSRITATFQRGGFGFEFNHTAADYSTVRIDAEVIIRLILVTRLD